MSKQLTAEEIITWLNGRACAIEAVHNGKRYLLWSPQDATSIEDMVEVFIKEHGIDVRKEIGLE
jgi:hypothetical protein